MKGPAVVVPEHSSRFFGAGENCTDAQEGDLVLVRHTGFVAAAIRFFERLGAPKEYAWCNHAAIVLSTGVDTLVVQCTAKGVVTTPLADLAAKEYAVVNFDMTPTQRDAVVRFARWSVGLGYGFLSIPADAMNAATGSELGLVIGNRMVCSTMACRALERGGLIPDRSPYAVTPAHLAHYASATR